VKKLWSLVTTVQLAWAALIANCLVILQGAIVRITGSGAGCGRHWPACNGEIIPLSHTTESLIEFSHRLLSLFVLILGAALLARVIRQRKQNRPLFISGVASFVLLLNEAMLGALTVLWGLTGDTVSTARGLMVATHLINSVLLVGALTLTVVYARKNAPPAPNLAKQGTLLTVLAVGLIGMLVLMFSGGIAAMGNTMFPSENLSQGVAADFDPNSHILIRLRVLHPIIAITVGVYLFLSLGLSWLIKPVKEAKRLSQTLFSVYVIQLVIGMVNWAFLAPSIVQLLHLATAVLAFGLLTALSAYALGLPASRPSSLFRRTIKEA
jgi:heme A synthase